MADFLIQSDHTDLYKNWPSTPPKVIEARKMRGRQARAMVERWTYGVTQYMKELRKRGKLDIVLLEDGDDLRDAPRRGDGGRRPRRIGDSEQRIPPGGSEVQ